jgi:hypothetical protein
MLCATAFGSSFGWAILLACLFLASFATPVQADEPIRGKVGVGTWQTQAEFKDVRVTKGDQTLFASDFAKGHDGWTIRRGTWITVDGILRQTSDEPGAVITVGDASWADYTLTLKARKLSGNEGFLILFGLPDDKSKSWWNLGGWGNARHGIESQGLFARPVDGKIETGRWYDIRITLRGDKVEAYLDGQLVHSAQKVPAQRTFANALIPDFAADPSILEVDGTFYLYATTDGMGRGLDTSGLPVVWKSKDFKNWSFTGSIFADNFDAKYWAPSVPVRKDGKFYLFATLNHRITALVADRPEGPFRTLDGKDITPTSGWKHFPINVGHPIDAEVFRDDDGSYYMVWSQRFIAKMNADFTAFEGDPVEIRTHRGGYSEGPFLFKRNDIYYYLYTLGGSEGYQYAYMMSRTSPLGPWEAPPRDDIISRTNHDLGIFGPGHGCVFKPSDSNQWYFVYLEYGRSSTNRQVLADKLNFNADGTIQPVKLTNEGVGALRTDPDYAKPNLALGKSATTSSTRSDLVIPPTNDPRLHRIESFAAANALDDNNSSRWMASDDNREPTITLDLGAAFDVTRTELYFTRPTAGHAYRIDTSLDGQSWTPYASHAEPAVRSPHRDDRATRTRYIRVTITSGEAGLWSFRVY